MKLSLIKNAVTSKVGRQVLVAQKNSPHIMFGAGVVGVVATAVLASRATLKLDDVLEETQENLAKARALRASGGANGKTYSEGDYQHDVVYLYTKASMKIAKLYAPTITVGVLSIASLTGAHTTLTRRNTGLLAAYATVDKAFSEYRERVLADVGPDKEREYYNGVDEREVYSEEKNGEPKVETIKSAKGASQYGRIFGEAHPEWQPTPEYNVFWLKARQNYLNQLLQSRGHVTLNDVYDQLCFDRTPAGAVVGWLKDGEGDGYIDFGIWDEENADRMYDFMTGREGSIVLDFNVDGIIYDQI